MTLTLAPKTRARLGPAAIAAVFGLALATLTVLTTTEIGARGLALGAAALLIAAWAAPAATVAICAAAALALAAPRAAAADPVFALAFLGALATAAMAVALPNERHGRRLAAIVLAIWVVFTCEYFTLGLFSSTSSRNQTEIHRGLGGALYALRNVYAWARDFVNGERVTPFDCGLGPLATKGAATFGLAWAAVRKIPASFGVKCLLLLSPLAVVAQSAGLAATQFSLPTPAQSLAVMAQKNATVVAPAWETYAGLTAAAPSADRWLLVWAYGERSNGWSPRTAPRSRQWLTSPVILCDGGRHELSSWTTVSLDSPAPTLDPLTGAWLLVGNQGRTVCRLDAERQQIVGCSPSREVARSRAARFAFSPSGRTLASYAPADREPLSIYRADDLERQNRILPIGPHCQRWTAAAFTAESRLAAFCADDQAASLSVFELTDEGRQAVLVARQSLPLRPDVVELTPTSQAGRALAIDGRPSFCARLCLLDLDAGLVLRTRRLPLGMRTLRAIRGADRYAVGSEAGLVLIVDRDLRTVATFYGGQRIKSLTQLGSQLFAASQAGIVAFDLAHAGLLR